MEQIHLRIITCEGLIDQAPLLNMQIHTIQNTPNVLILHGGILHCGISKGAMILFLQILLNVTSSAAFGIQTRKLSGWIITTITGVGLLRESPTLLLQQRCMVAFIIASLFLQGSPHYITIEFQHSM